MNQRFFSLGLPLAALTVILFSGCVGKQHLDITYYSLDTPEIGKVIAEPKLGTVFVRDFYMNPTFEDKNFNYQTGDLTYETDFYNQFKLSPRSLFTTLMRSTLKESGLFKAVLMPESSMISDYALEADVQKFCADFRDPQNPKAYLSINFSLSYNPKKGLERPVLFTKTYTQAVPVAKRSAAEVAKAWNTAYANIARQLVQDLATVNPPPPQAAPAPAAKSRAESSSPDNGNSQ
jgi:ABC-type uncharacterized transport system auxiliary subunit